MNGFNISEFTDMIKQLEQLGADVNQVAERVLDAGSEPARQKFQKNLPKDTGQARKNVVVSKTKTARNKNKYRLIGSETKKIDPETGKEVPYLYIVEYGHVRAPAHPFIEKAYRAAQAAASEPMKSALVKEIENHLR